jgi:hypothetical protein
LAGSVLAEWVSDLRDVRARARAPVPQELPEVDSATPWA